jgi:hypothetical protein
LYLYQILGEPVLTIAILNAHTWLMADGSTKPTFDRHNKNATTLWGCVESQL